MKTMRIDRADWIETAGRRTGKVAIFPVETIDGIDHALVLMDDRSEPEIVPVTAIVRVIPAR